MKKKNWLVIASLLTLSVVIHFYSCNSISVENYYSTGIYYYISLILRSISGLFPFSIGDILYGLIFLWLIIKLIQLIRSLFHCQFKKKYLKNLSIKLISALLSVYIIFNILWGINYNRKGIAYQLGLKTNDYTVEDLKHIDQLLLQKVNESKMVLLQNKDSIQNKNELVNKSIQSYNEIAKHYPFLTYKKIAVKSSLWGWLGNYLGFTGYYNPFTGEAQVNTTVPKFLQPYITCHEMAHQLGYAKEDEANFVGYLAASASTDTLFHYSVYLDLFVTCNRNLYVADSASAISFSKQLLPQVRTDLKEWKIFILQHNNPFQPLVEWLYGKYLQNNQQPSGVLTYDEVTDLLIEYYKKTGKI
ncbi:MAG: DUF3810 domain-containing protein [Ferruginibacter sp.]